MNKKRNIRILLVTLTILMICLGIRMNMWVISHNDGKMPVINWDGKSNNQFALYQNATNETKYLWLADRQNWIFGCSIGDLVMWLSFIPFIFFVFMKEELNKAGIKA